MSQWLQAVLLGLLEGLTEFIPVSSTGHLIVVGHLIEFTGAKAATFEVFIQLGAILSVVFLYKERFFALLSFEKSEGFSGLNGLKLLALTTFPALVIGAVAHSYIKSYLFNPITVATGLGVGGIIIIAVERKLSNDGKAQIDELNYRDALLIGLFQCLAMWPGVSRSGATIIGGMLIGVERKTAAEYSFLAAVPVMCAATIYDVYKSRAILDASDISTFTIGFIVSFIAAVFAVKYFIHLLGRHTLKPFGWYRIGLALAIIAFSI
ncbi:MAG: undecaprenyl-diphosphate phosphatase [Nitrospiria bacterium]